MPKFNKHGSQREALKKTPWQNWAQEGINYIGQKHERKIWKRPDPMSNNFVKVTNISHGQKVLMNTMIGGISMAIYWVELGIVPLVEHGTVKGLCTP
jgi:hypothetical protein